jgi:hypothetical protein
MIFFFALKNPVSPLLKRIFNGKVRFDQIFVKGSSIRTNAHTPLTVSPFSLSTQFSVVILAQADRLVECLTLKDQLD